jgi:hypothetical protein
MTVLGLLKFAERQDASFLLDEPDTHLNPTWQLNYVEDDQEEEGWNNEQVADSEVAPALVAARDRG